VTDTIKPGIVIMHYSSSEEELNALFTPIFDPLSSTPEMKACAVKIEGVSVL
jgi:anaerobic selenocysteine-containing dehydrogenase